jgi:hypothetical protein
MYSCIYISAQYNTKSEWYIGVSGGETMSTINLVPKLVDKMFAFNNDAGLAIRYVSEEHFGLQAEINYFQSGWKEDQQGLGLTSSYERQINFVELPFMLHAYAGSEHFRYFLNVGPKVAYLYSESENIIDNTVSYEQHGKLVEKPFQYGIVAGAGFEAHLWKTVFGLEGRYCYQLSDIFNDNIGDYFNTSSLQTISLNFYLFFRVK